MQTVSAGTLERRRAQVGTDDLTVVPVRHYGRWICAVLLTIVVAGLLYSLVTNPNLQVDVIRQYLFASPILKGVLVTLELTAIAMVLGVAGGVLIALMHGSPNPILRTLAWLYVWFFRGTPIIMQVLFWGYLGAFYDNVSLGIPFTHVHAVSTSTQALISPFLAAVLALTLNEAAYSSEIIRGGLASVGEGQVQAAQSLGMTRAQTLRDVVLPQTMRIVLPPLGNATILMLKTTSLVSVIGGLDLLTRVQHIYQQSLQVIPLLIVAGLWYLFLVTILSIGQTYLERRFNRGIHNARL